MIERKIVQIQITKFDDRNHALYILVLCNDGTLWFKALDSTKSKWSEYPSNVPQDGIREIN